MTKIPDDPVVADIHAVRKALLDKCGGDFNEYLRQARERQQKSERRIISNPLRHRTEPSVERELRRPNDSAQEPNPSQPR